MVSMSVLDLKDVITMYKYYIYYCTICNTFKKKFHYIRGH